MKFNDKFYPTDLKTLLQIVLKQLNQDEVLGLRKELFFSPQADDFFAFEYLGKKLHSPVGVAAGPQTQLAQNIIVAWLAGARFIELKTIQTLDELEISKPCIDMQDEGYNVEWSQELKIKQSFDQYLNAWIIIHILQKELGFSELGTIFNISAGYNLEGIMKPNVQWFFDKVTDASAELEQKLEEIKDIYPKINELNIPSRLTDNITLSTMHGCPPDEIEQIAQYLLTERKFNTIIKLNPTLLGKEKLHEILRQSGFKTEVPDIAFEHDLKYSDAVPMLKRLRKTAEQNNVFFGIKLTNTLESNNNKNTFSPEEKMMYMSGRALHPISINLAAKIQTDFDGLLPVSFSAGVDAFNITDVLTCGLRPVTVCSDLLKPGGYGRLHQYYEFLRKHNATNKSIADLINNTAQNKFETTEQNALFNLKNYAQKVLNDKRYKKNSFTDPSIKTNRKLTTFDCIAAPCTETCPTNQNVPQYMYAVQNNNLADAIRTVLDDNPFPTVTGYVCDHTCQLKCTRINYDEALNIREVKRYIADTASIDTPAKITPVENTTKVAIIGAGPAGLSAAYYLKIYGFDVEIFEKRENAGGMVANAIPSFRLQDRQVEADVQKILALGVKIHFNHKIDSTSFENLRNNFDFIFVSPGAAASMKINLPGSDGKGVYDPLEFFYEARHNPQLNIGKKVAVIGGGNTAMDAARIAKRLVGKDGKVTIYYRRKIENMPAHYFEIMDTMEENIEFVELTEPEEIILEQGKVKGLRLHKTKLVKAEGEKRPRPVAIKNSTFEVEADTIIPAFGQQNDFDFLSDDDFSEKNIPYTKYDNIFIGGDAARGAASIIKAVADGKHTAYEIIKRLNKNFKPEKFKVQKEINYIDLKIKRAKRVYATEPDELPIDKRTDFQIVTKTYTPEQAQAEAERCLLCDELCDTCVSVCPNLANQGYWVEPFEVTLPEIYVTNGMAKLVEGAKFEIKQSRQTYNIADWCNECGNCATFCPTAGKPYLDKPKVHLSEESYRKSPWGFRIIKNNDEKIVKYKANGGEATLTIKKETFEYEDSAVKASFNKDFELKEFFVKHSSGIIRFNRMLQMYVVSHIEL